MRAGSHSAANAHNDNSQGRRIIWRMSELGPLQGDLQTQVMSALWRLSEGDVEQVRSALPPRYRSAYTTVQTVMNRLADRGLLEREREGRVFVYRPVVTEAEYLSRSIEHTLAGASASARHAALAQLLGRLDEGEISDLRRLAAEIDTARRPKSA